jgi:hypothetical protein
MSVVEDVRQIVQDFLAPELRAIAARLDAVEETAKSRHQELLARMTAYEATSGARISSLEAVVLAKLDAQSNRIDGLNSV